MPVRRIENVSVCYSTLSYWFCFCFSFISCLRTELLSYRTQYAYSFFHIQRKVIVSQSIKYLCKIFIRYLSSSIVFSSIPKQIWARAINLIQWYAAVWHGTFQVRGPFLLLPNEKACQTDTPYFERKLMIHLTRNCLFCVDGIYYSINFVCKSERWTVVVVLCWTNNRFWDFEKKKKKQIGETNKIDKQQIIMSIVSTTIWFLSCIDFDICILINKKKIAAKSAQWIIYWHFGLLYINRCWLLCSIYVYAISSSTLFLTTKVTNLWDNDTHIYFKSIHPFVFRSTNRPNAAHTTWWCLKSNQIKS